MRSFSHCHEFNVIFAKKNLVSLSLSCLDLSNTTTIFICLFLCLQRNFGGGGHIVIALSVRLSVCPSRFRVRSISPIFFEVGISNLVCICILGWRSVAYHFGVTLTLNLTSDLVFRIIVSGAYLLYYLR